MRRAVLARPDQDATELAVPARNWGAAIVDSRGAGSALIAPAVYGALAVLAGSVAGSGGVALDRLGEQHHRLGMAPVVNEQLRPVAQHLAQL